MHSYWILFTGLVLPTNTVCCHAAQLSAPLRALYCNCQEWIREISKSISIRIKGLYELSLSTEVCLHDD